MTDLIIPKEQISAYSFSVSHVEKTAEKTTAIIKELYKAMIIGNTSHGKVKIEFETNNGPLAVETTVWAATEKNVLLKGGVSIPVESVNEIRI